MLKQVKTLIKDFIQYILKCTDISSCHNKIIYSLKG